MAARQKCFSEKVAIMKSNYCEEVIILKKKLLIKAAALKSYLFRKK